MGPGEAPLGKPIAHMLWVMRVTWGALIVVCLSFLAPPLLWALALTPDDVRRAHCMSALGPGGIWCAAGALSWQSYVEAAIVVLASVSAPAAIHRQSIARLRRRALLEIDPSRPGVYRSAPGTRARLADRAPALRSATARYASKLALSFALVAILPFLAAPLMRRVGPFPNSCCEVHPCYADPAGYTPLLLAVVCVVAIQYPTRRRALRCIEDL